MKKNTLKSIRKIIKNVTDIADTVSKKSIEAKTKFPITL